VLTDYAVMGYTIADNKDKYKGMSIPGMVAAEQFLRTLVGY
jgi:hypothetical protein